MIKKLGKIIGLFSSVAIIFSIFLSYIDLKAGELSLFSMSLIELNKYGAIILAALAFAGFIFAYANKGILTSLIGILIFVGNIFLFNNMSTGIEELDQLTGLLSELFGDLFTPGIGFIVATLGSLLLFLSGVLINKNDDEKKTIDKKKLIIISSCIGFVLVVLIIVVLFVYPGYLKKSKNISDNNTGQSMNVKDNKVQAYLPVNIKITSDYSYNNSETTIKYSNGRMVDKEYQGKMLDDSNVSSKYHYSYDIDDNISHVTIDDSNNDFKYEWSFDYTSDGTLKTISTNEQSVQEDDGTLSTPNEVYEYNSYGLLSNHYCSSMITFTTDNREYYSYQYDEDNHINSINCDSDFDAKSVGLKYDNDFVTDVVSESTDSDKYWYKKYSLSREGNHITQMNLDGNDSVLDETYSTNIKYNYSSDKIESIDYSDSMSIGEGDSFNTTFNYSFEYTDNKLTHILCTDDLGNNYKDYQVNYENDQISEVSVNDIDNKNTTIKIEYELYEISQDEWTDYKDYYYSVRYNLLHDYFSFIESDGEYPGLLEINDGYHDQYLEYMTWDYKLYAESDKLNEWFSWVTLPKVINREYYKKAD